MVRGAFRGIETDGVFRLFNLRRTLWRHPYILRLTFSAGIGSLLFGYLTGVISIAYFDARDDFRFVLNETVVSMAIVGGIFGAGFGGWMIDHVGRKFSILTADVLIFLGAILLPFSSWVSLIVAGTILVGFGIGMASMIAPIYISESCPVRLQTTLVSTTGLLVAAGQFLSYQINLHSTKKIRTWSSMVEVAGFPALVQFMLLLSLPESLKWLNRKEKREIAVKDSSSILSNIRRVWSTPLIRRALVAGIGLHVVQQVLGINTVMYYVPNILELAGNKKLLAGSVISYSLDNVLKWIFHSICADKYGRRKPILYTMCGISACFFLLTIIFALAANGSPAVSRLETSTNYGNYTCGTYMTAPDAASWNCLKCLQASSGCGFCAIKGDMLQPGACLTANPSGGGQASCLGEEGKWFTKACPRESYGSWASTILALYIHLYSGALGTIPWVVNSEIYPLRHRGICAGMAATANWLSYLIVSTLFLSFTKALGSAYTFLLLGSVSCLALVFIDLFVPEMRGGLPLEPYIKRWVQKLAGFLT